MEMEFKCVSNLNESLIARSSEILSAVKFPQTIHMNKIIDVSSIIDLLKCQDNPCLNILSGFQNFIDKLPVISNPLQFHSDKSSDVSNFILDNENPIVSYQSKIFEKLIKPTHNTTKHTIFSHENLNISNSVNQSIFQSHSTDTDISSAAKYIHSVVKNIHRQIPSSAALNPTFSISVVDNSNKNPILQCLNQKESETNRQCRRQEKDGLECRGQFTFPVLNQALNNIETKSVAQSIISKVMDTLKVLEFTNVSAISATNRASHNVSHAIFKSNSVSDTHLCSNYLASNYQNVYDNSSIVKSLASIYSTEKLSQNNESNAIFSGISIDRLIGSVNIHHSGLSLNDDNIKHELEQAVLTALSKILERNLDDST